ncbi:unnamed protein product [Aureobasidium uvarum]|uniref:Uncharacterized protein n=1 Tax=Aureobasidium uvarum TaxID=2773716 RepID=A0A9N8KIR7_9PEZI|nr:unnamed protein product [Aureobasidium uvarum]
MRSSTTGDGWPDLPGAACSQDSTDTWAGRDAMISAVKDFCAGKRSICLDCYKGAKLCTDPHHTRGSKGELTSATFGSDFDYMNVSISWEGDGAAVISEHGCSTWLDIMTDGCNVPQSGQSSDKHGGLIEYTNTKLNATLKIEPLVVRRIWDGGQAGGQQCNSIDTNNYIDQGTLASNIGDFCTKSAGQNIAESDSIFSQIYNDGTPDRVELSTQWPKGQRNYQVFQDECVHYMSVIK